VQVPEQVTVRERRRTSRPQVGQKADAVDRVSPVLFRYRNARGVENRRKHVEVSGVGVGHFVGRDYTRPPDDRRYADAAFISLPLGPTEWAVVAGVFVDHRPVVTHEDDERIVHHADFAKRGQQTANRRIHVGEDGTVIAPWKTDALGLV